MSEAQQSGPADRGFNAKEWIVKDIVLRWVLQGKWDQLRRFRNEYLKQVVRESQGVGP